MTKKDQLLSQALKMNPLDRAEIADRILQSLDKPDKEIDKMWKKEAEDRIDAFETEDIQTVTVQEIIAKYMKG